MMYKIKYDEREHYYSTEKMFLRMYRRFSNERKKWVAKGWRNPSKLEAYVINDDWAKISVLEKP